MSASGGKRTLEHWRTRGLLRAEPEVLLRLGRDVADWTVFGPAVCINERYLSITFARYRGR